MSSTNQNILEKPMKAKTLVTIRNWISAHFVRKDGDKVLSDNNYTNEDKAKVDNCIVDIDMATNEEVDEMLDEVFGSSGNAVDAGSTDD